MKKIRKTVTKANSKELRKQNNLTIYEISLDDKTNQEYFDTLAYEKYLRTLNNKNGGLSDE